MNQGHAVATNSSELNSQGEHIIDDFDSAIEEFAVSTIESSEVIQPMRDLSHLEHTIITEEDSQTMQNISIENQRSIKKSYDCIVIDDYDSPKSI